LTPVGSAVTLQLQSALSRGEVGQKDVQEFEKMMGIDIAQLSEMLSKSNNVFDSKKLVDLLGADAGETRELFQQLAKIKSQNNT
jgi:hypothetical protein